jgi:small multidrug resistance family-3 protein
MERFSRSTQNNLMQVIKSLLLFLLAGLCEIGGGYLIWLWMKDSKSFWYAIAGGALLVLYGIIATFQNAGFGRVYAVYGGVFIFLSLFWAWKVDHFIPDRFDVVGALFILIGIYIMFYIPRSSN